MGDIPPGSRPQALDNAATGFARGGHQNQPLSSPSPYKPLDNSAPFHSQLSSLPQNQLRPDFRPSAQYMPQEHGSSPLNMGSMAGALPDYSSMEDGQQALPRSLSGASTSAVVYQLSQNLQAPAHAPGNMPNHSAYGLGYGGNPYSQNQAYVASPGNPQQGPYQYAPMQSRMHMGPSMQPPYHSYPHAPQYMYYPTPYGSQAQFTPSFPAQGGQTQAGYDRRGSMDFSHPDPTFGSRMGPGNPQTPFAQTLAMPRAGPVSSIPRGPPRKPKQSGHALWVGNLPPGTTVVALKDHFSREATNDIESLFLISKSNCAFVNYRTEASCTAAMHRFHDSRFNGVRLVCRLRRSSAPAPGVPTGPSAMAGGQQTATPPKSPQLNGEVTDETQDEDKETQVQNGEKTPVAASSFNKYFIVKSLTLQDLELSVRNNIWATQAHNEEALNNAFRSTDNVYLIFSANKSGEYFGYARMTSAILEDGSKLVGSAPKPENVVDAPDVPKSIPTPATEWAPKGKIIDDSARGTIFWEAELSEPEVEDANGEREESQADGDASVVAQSWGKPFRIEWLSTNRLPFYRTRGLRNPWNANREVKIARDGQELEPSVGDRLVQMFHRLGPSNATLPIITSHSSVGGPGMPQTHPF